jgi:hypothetical protein
VESGAFHLDGAPAAVIGLNYFDGFRRQLEAGVSREHREAIRPGFDVLARHEIPFVRFAACGFYPSELRLHLEDPAAYFGKLDAFVAEAERVNVGLIPSLFWAFFAVPDLVGEPIQAWGDAASRTRAYMRRYTSEVVSRYRHSRAIWAWEFGNEFNLEADIPTLNTAEHWIVPSLGTPSSRSETDRIRHQDILPAFAEFAALARSLDPHRPIMTGNTVPRSSAWHLRRGLGWKPDSLSQGSESLLADNPDPVDTLSVHVYANFDREPHYFLSGQAVPESLAALLGIAASSGKPLWLGEFGSSPKGTPEARRAETEAFVAEIVRQRIQLSALWVFDTLNRDIAVWNVREDNENAYALTLLRDANRRLRASATTP